MNLTSAVIMFFLIMDPLGNIPIFMTLLGKYEESKRRRIIIRESLVALVILSLFLFLGHNLLSVFSISQPALSISGGLVLFLIAIKMVFPIGEEGPFGRNPEGDPFIVPLAVPLIAGPSALSTVLIMVSKDSDRTFFWLGAIFIAWALSTLILYFSSAISRVLGPQMLAAIEKLMGLILTAISVQMFINGIEMLRR